MFSRLRRGWTIAQVGWLVIVDHPKLLLLPIFSGVALAALLSVIAAPLIAGARPEDVVGAFGYPLLFVIYLACMFIMVYFNAALVFCAVACFHGREPSVREGLDAAWARSPQILGWALVASTVGLLLGWLEGLLKDNLGWLGSWLGVGVQFAWAAATYFVAPVLVVEGLGPIDAIRRSSTVLRQTWGEVAGGESGLSLLGFLLFIPLVLFVVMASEPFGWFLWGLVMLCGVALAVVLSAVGTIFQTGAYLFATSGSVPPGMDEGMLSNAFRMK